MNELPEDRRLFREAADLAIRLQGDPDNRVSVDMVNAWISRSPSHRSAWKRVAEIHGMSGQVLTERYEALEPKRGAISRRTLLVTGLVGAGAIATGSVAVPDLVVRIQADHATVKGEIQRIDLEDGSVVTLGPASAIAIDYAASHRIVRLLAGMAYFDVASDTTRPFSVISDEVAATALGTAYDVSNDAGIISVSVDHGRVAARIESGRIGEELMAGDWIVYNPGTHAVMSRGTRDISQIAAWRNGMIVAEHESVSVLVARIGRWLPGKIVIADPFLGARLVSGVFDLSDPERALAAVIRPFGARLRQAGPFLTILTPV
ncbi:FecR domain-containing protein [Shinella curvata]|uniref:FecR domain-containing protein n=1 Tax=Shinella curvata TaxID=1817964 RepID=A0ABT8XEB7_9HYPH|nr:FecR domain-containing protein [Shinella curvata]MCJ8055371.1 FecR domain-containing protein [Shinella curvata]MDO6121788.1 FecR domain-containing protein [Shinella curvata]